MLNLLIKAVSHFKFWNIMVIACLATAFISIEARSLLKPYLSADIRSILKEVHETAGFLLVISACFHGLGRSGYLMRLNRKRQERDKIA